MTALEAAGVCLAWMTGFVVMARREYRRVYAESLARWKRLYGPTLPGRARRDALDKAYEMIYKWPLAMIFGIMDWLIVSERLLGVPDAETDCWLQDPTEELIKRLDRELESAGYEEAKYGPLNGASEEKISPEIDPAPCPCGYRTECHIRCGTGECHPEMIIPMKPGVRYER